MASPLRYTLVSDGSSDRALLPIIDWVLERIPGVTERGIERQWADLRAVPREAGLAGKISTALRYYPCDILFVHRDAESSERRVHRERLDEIREAMQGQATPYVGVVPVRMTEAWLLIDAQAIRLAADNPNSQAQIQLPALGDLEDASDPKAILHDLLLKASEFQGRRRDKFKRDLSWRRELVAERIADFAPLRRLSSFAAFEQEATRVVAALAAED